ncbi:MAG TPA: membrane protein insertion efficiency factor YidD [Chloroflexota bacterium]|nr:membrane protein insertion efficiency factor YidD [Chloroflexota bacterium]
MKHVLLILINLYRGCVSALIPTSCRFYPTCSAYGKEAIERHGARFGLWLTLRRLARCHPWSQGGYDPVP